MILNVLHLKVCYSSRFHFRPILGFNFLLKLIETDFVGASTSLEGDKSEEVSEGKEKTLLDLAN